MANALYQKGREKFLKGEIAWLTDNIKAALVLPTYVPDTTTHEYFSSISSYILTGTVTCKKLSGKGTSAVINSVTNYGIATAAPTTFSTVTSNQTIGFIVLFKDSDGVAGDGPPAVENEATSPLICIFDSGYGIGAGTNGGDIRVTWDAVNGIFKL